MTIKGIDFDFTDLITVCTDTENDAYKTLGLDQDIAYQGLSKQEALKKYYSFKEYIPKGLTEKNLWSILKGKDQQTVENDLYRMGSNYIYATRQINGRLLSAELNIPMRDIHFSNPMTRSAAKDFAMRLCSARKDYIIDGILKEIIILFASSLRQDILTYAQTNPAYFAGFTSPAKNATYYISDNNTLRQPNFRVVFNTSLNLNFLEDIKVEGDGYPYGIEIKNNLSHFHITEFNLTAKHSGQFLKLIEKKILNTLDKSLIEFDSQETYEVVVELNLDLLDELVSDVLSVKYNNKRFDKKLFFITSGNKTYLGSEFFSFLNSKTNDLYLEFGQGEDIVVNSWLSPNEVNRSSLETGKKKFSPKELYKDSIDLFNTDSSSADLKKQKQELAERVAKGAMQKLNKISLWYGKPV